MKWQFEIEGIQLLKMEFFFITMAILVLKR